MSTLGELIDSIQASLHSYTGVQETYTWLTANATPTDTQIQVNDSQAILRGIAEIEDEMIFVDSSASGILNLAPFGRGYRGSTAAAHTTNAPVLFDPAFPRVEVKKRINKVVAALYPALYQIKTTSFTADGTTLGISLPADADKVFRIEYLIPGDPTNQWYLVQDFQEDPTNVAGKTLLLANPITAGATVQVTYRANFGTFVSSTDTLASVGLQESWADLIEYAVTAHMVRFLEPARLQMPSVENVARAQMVQSGDAAKIANQLYAMYQQRLAEERRRILLLTPPTISYQR